MVKQMLFEGIEAAPEEPKDDHSIKQQVRIGRPVEETVLTFTIQVRIEVNTVVEVRLLYDHVSGKVKRLQQGKGETWKDLKLSRKQVTRIKFVIKQMGEKHFLAKQNPKEDLFT